MQYRKKITVLAASAVLLALLYTLTLVFDPARVNERNAAFSWLGGDSRDLIDRLEIYRGSETPFIVTLKNGAWVSPLGDGSVDAPVKQGRVDELLRLLTTRGAFPRRGSSAASYGELGLDDDGTRLVLKGGAGLPLLELIVGKEDSAGGEVFLRRRGEAVFRSGERLIASYVNGNRSDWYDLKLFGQYETPPVDRIQRVRIMDGGESTAFSRGGGAWLFEDGGAVSPDRAESYLRSFFESSGEDFVYPADFDESGTSVTLELGDASVITVRFGVPLDESGKRLALASGKPYAYLLPQWTVSRLLRDRAFFRGD
ncbi:MAG: DUF4340 domain-containing protein [Treponema sp.]|jgi:hypothetical protein|nr:DUF4340 domain-containing protein [Treponema sp.]